MLRMLVVSRVGAEPSIFLATADPVLSPAGAETTHRRRLFRTLAGLKLRPETKLYLGLVHRDDMAGNAARLAAARSHVRVDGVATECGMARGDPARFSELLAAHAKTAELASG